MCGTRQTVFEAIVDASIETAAKVSVASCMKLELLTAVLTLNT